MLASEYLTRYVLLNDNALTSMKDQTLIESICDSVKQSTILLDNLIQHYCEAHKNHLKIVNEKRSLIVSVYRLLNFFTIEDMKEMQS